MVRVEWGKPPDLGKVEGDIRGWKMTYDPWKTTTLKQNSAVSLSSKINREKGHDTKIVSYHSIFFHIIKKQRPFSNAETCAKVVVFQGS